MLVYAQGSLRAAYRLVQQQEEKVSTIFDFRFVHLTLSDGSVRDYSS